MPVKFVSLEANEPEPAGHREVRDAAFTSPAGCGTREGVMTFIDADKLFINTIGEVPFTFEYASRKLKETPYSGGGILKRLMAGVRSATQRGLEAGDYTITPTGIQWGDQNGVVLETVQTVDFHLFSHCGRWSGRQWEFATSVDIAIDEDCNESFSVLDKVGVATITSKDGSDPTEFRGQCVAHFALEIFHRCVRHQFAMNTVHPVVVTPEPEWCSRALTGLAQIAARAAVAGDVSGMSGLTEYLSGNWCAPEPGAHVMMVDTIVSTIGTRHQAASVIEAYITWKNDPLSDLGDEIWKVVGNRPHLLGCIDMEDAFRVAANEVAETQD